MSFLLINIDSRFNQLVSLGPLQVEASSPCVTGVRESQEDSHNARGSGERSGNSVSPYSHSHHSHCDG